MYVGINIVHIIGKVRVRVSNTGIPTSASSTPALSFLARHHFSLTLHQFTPISPFRVPRLELSFRSLITNVGPLAKIRISVQTRRRIVDQKKRVNLRIAEPIGRFFPILLLLSLSFLSALLHYTIASIYKISILLETTSKTIGKEYIYARRLKAVTQSKKLNRLAEFKSQIINIIETSIPSN